MAPQPVEEMLQTGFDWPIGWDIAQCWRHTDSEVVALEMLAAVSAKLVVETTD